MQNKQFQAESKRLLDLMINSIYTNKEIFLRELISNASDALDKLYYRALTDESLSISRQDLFVTISPDKNNRTLMISDNGIGMTHDELDQNLGTIAKSGSLAFRQELEKSMDELKPNIDIIGQFGVGFYSAFMIADNVTVRSKAFGSDQAFEWKSAGSDGYTITEYEKMDWGTDVIIQLKEDSEDEKFSRFLEEYTLAGLVKKYSDYIAYPIKMERERRRPIENPDDNKDSSLEFETYREVETLNSMVPVWQRGKSEVSEDDYNAFYTEKFHDWEKPLLRTHVNAEGIVSYKALLFVPAKAAYDFYTKDYKPGLALYSSGVMIMEKCSDLLPDHFRFIQGVVDTPDISLNISREMLQHNRQVSIIAQNLEKKIKSELTSLLSNDREKYEQFWRAFGIQLKYGVVAEFGANKDILKDLLLFASSNSDKPTTFAEYVERMKDGQENIYFATGESVRMISRLPQTEKLREKGYEILYLVDDVDEFAIQILREYKEKQFKSVNSGDLGLESDDEKQEVEKKKEEFGGLLGFVKETLGDRVKEVKLSAGLITSPICLSAGGHLSFEMEKYLSAVKSESAPKADRILELNPDHKVFENLSKLFESDKEKAKVHIEILYSQALMSAGLPIDDPSAYSEMIFGLLRE